MSVKPSTSQTCNTQSCLTCGWDAQLNYGIYVPIDENLNYTGQMIFHWAGSIVYNGSRTSYPYTITTGGYTYYASDCTSTTNGIEVLYRICRY